MLEGKFCRNKIEKSTSNNTIPKSRAGGRRPNFAIRENFTKIKIRKPDPPEFLMPTCFKNYFLKFEFIWEKYGCTCCDIFNHKHQASCAYTFHSSK